MNTKIDRVSGTVILIFAVYLVIHIVNHLRIGDHSHPGPGYVPLLLVVLLGILGGILLFQNNLDQSFKTIRWTGLSHMLCIIGCCFFSILALEKLGYRLTTMIILVVLFGFLERLKIWVVIVLTFGLSFGSFWIFYTILKVPLPIGVF